ncbi:Peroxin-3 [Thermothelomyces heterothallicus CBS 203.75]
MLAATKRWFRRNRTPIAIGLGVVGAGYIVTNYVSAKLRDARERMSSDRIAKENLRRRFEQNQEDCTFTVLALLPTATANILKAMDTEQITYEIQQIKGSTAARTRSIGSTSPPSMSEANAADDDGRSIITVSAQSEAGLQTTQISVATPSSAAAPPESHAASAPPETALAPPKPRKTKRQLWDDLKISAIARAFTLLYTLSLLTMLTRIQLNLLSRRSYLSSVVSLATGGNAAPGTINLENNDDDGAEEAYGTDFEVNRKYLTFSWWLLNRGWVDVMHRVEAAVRQVFGHLSPRDTISLHTFSKLTHGVRSIVEGSGPSTEARTAWLPFLLPPVDMEDFVLRESGVLEPDPVDNAVAAAQGTSPTPATPAPPSTAASLRRLLDETADLIESPHFAHVHTQLLDAGFSALLEQKVASGVFDANNTPLAAADPLGGAGAILGNRAVLLPKILSVLTRQAHAIGQGMSDAVPPTVNVNEYLQAMEAVPDLEGFAAVVYSSNWQAEIVPDDGADGESRPHSQPQPQPGVSKALPRVGGAHGEGQHQRLGESSTVFVDGEEGQTSLFDSAWEKASASK